MDKKPTRNAQNKFSYFGEPTLAKTGGLAYSAATVFLIFSSFLFLLVLTMAGLADEGYDTKDWFLYCSYLLPQIVLFATAVFCLKFSKTPIKEYAKSQKCKPIYFLVALLLQIGLWSLSELNGLFLKFLGRFGYEDGGILLPSMDGIGFVGILLVVALLPAVMEEFLFRGVLLNGLKSFKTLGAVLVCGALFSLYHRNPAQTLYQFCCGAAFALVAIRSGSILPTVLSHFINNAVILILTKCGVTAYPTPVFIVVVCVSAVCLAISLWYLIFKDKKEEYPTDGEERKRFFLFAAVGIAVCGISWILALLSGF